MSVTGGPHPGSPRAQTLEAWTNAPFTDWSADRAYGNAPFHA